MCVLSCPLASSLNFNLNMKGSKNYKKNVAFLLNKMFKKERKSELNSLI